jgi:ABC-type uncharacterized transport system permease subunit
MNALRRLEPLRLFQLAWLYVRLGALDFALTRPEDTQAIVSLREVRIWTGASA